MGRTVSNSAMLKRMLSWLSSGWLLGLERFGFLQSSFFGGLKVKLSERGSEVSPVSSNLTTKCSDPPKCAVLDPTMAEVFASLDPTITEVCYRTFDRSSIGNLVLWLSLDMEGDQDSGPKNSAVANFSDTSSSAACGDLSEANSCKE